MPNYCWNTTDVTGPAEQITEFHQRVLTEEGDIQICESLLPLPDWATKTVDGGSFTVFANGGYQTAVDLWGSKWGDFSHEVTDTPGHYVYQTAWSPITNGLKAISDMFKDLRFVTRWYEEDYHHGIFVCEWGMIREHNLGRLDTAPPPNLSEDKEEEWYAERWVVLQETTADLII